MVKLNNDQKLMNKFNLLSKFMNNTQTISFEDFETTILTKLKLNYENICSKYGYIKKDTIKIIKRSVGQLKKEHFNANIYFEKYNTFL